MTSSGMGEDPVVSSSPPPGEQTAPTTGLFAGLSMSPSNQKETLGNNGSAAVAAVGLDDVTPKQSNKGLLDTPEGEAPPPAPPNLNEDSTDDSAVKSSPEVVENGSDTLLGAPREEKIPAENTENGDSGAMLGEFVVEEESAKEASIPSNSDGDAAEQAVSTDPREGVDDDDDDAPVPVAENGNPPEKENAEAGDDGETPVTPVPSRKDLPPKDEQALNEAFADSSSERGGKQRRKPTAKAPRGLGRVHPDTHIPHADVALSILRKFVAKTQPHVINTYGGTKSRGLWNYLFGSKKEDPTFVPYRDLLDHLLDINDEEAEDDDDDDEDADDEPAAETSTDDVVERLAGHDGDSMARARDCMARFVYLFGQWGHASSRLLDAPAKTKEWFGMLLSFILDAATQLVAHGCWDDVQIGLSSGGGSTDGNGDEEDDDVPREYHSAVYMLTQSVLNSDLTMESNELSAMKFLLTTGCRRSTGPSGLALLRGSHLLQTIRVLYHVYLTTESMSNKTTARAALQQLVTSVFTRVVVQQKEGIVKTSSAKDSFPSDSHRDAFLALRSLCKLSMRNLPDGGMLGSHVGLQASGSNETWDGKENGHGHGPGGSEHEDDDIARSNGETAQLVYTSAIHPALESKILALELLLYVLQNIDFEREFIGQAGPQFHSAIRNYLCVSLLKNCLSDNTRVVNLSLRIFVPLMGSFRIILKNEIEAFVTNVFFVILDSPNSPVEHKSLVVNTFDEICSDPSTLAEIFLNYDCDLSAVDLFHRIVNTLSKMARAGVQEPKASAMSFMGGRDAARLERFRIENRHLRLTAMKALRQVLASLHASIVEPMKEKRRSRERGGALLEAGDDVPEDGAETPPSSPGRNLVEIYGSKKKRRAEESEVIIRFNQKPSAGLAYAAECGHVDPKDATDVAGYLLRNKDIFEKTQIGEYLGREAEYQGGFSLQVLHQYVRLMDFSGLEFDDAIRFFLSGFRLPGEAQKIDRIMEKFAERFTDQNPEVFPSADVAFILSFSIIMLNTDLHNPAIKEERRMTKEGFVRNNRGISDGQDLPEELLTAIFDRIQLNPISLKEDDEARERAGESSKGSIVGSAALNPASFFKSHYDDMDRARESNFQKERDHIVRTTETLLKRRKHNTPDGSKAAAKHRRSSQKASRFVRTEDTGLRDEYVSPMFEVTWGPALAAFSTAMESANGTVGSLVAIASDEELELAAENAAETIEVCLTGFRFAIGTAGLCGNETARDSYMLALSRFTQLGSGSFLEPRHVRCIQTLLSLAREDGELLGSSWQHVFRALSEINRFHQLFHLMARNDRAAASAAERRRARMEEKEHRRVRREERRIAAEETESLGPDTDSEFEPSEIDSLAESELFSDEDSFGFEDEMDSKAIDEMNARLVYEAVSEAWIEAIYERSSSLSAPAVKEFVDQLCFVSNSEISVGSGNPDGAMTDLNHVSYRQQHALLGSTSGGDQFHHSQPNIYNLQKLVEVTHYNMDSRPRLIFADLWATVASHLTMTALHSNPALAMYAVDSFRQLSIQYLKRDELEVFEFQKRFLKPLETVMARSSQSSTKELLLDCVDRVIQVFGAEPSARSSRKGGLRSGWIPILAILGLGGKDTSEDVATLSFKIVAREIERAFEKNPVDVLLNEHFVETVSAVLMAVSGPHEAVAIHAVEQLESLAAYLGDKDKPLPQVKRRAATGHSVSRQDHELWWPLLLGLSHSLGDIRQNVRTKGLAVLFKVIEDHFVPSVPREDVEQTLQLVFRGILCPVLEFAEVESEDGRAPNLPDDFERCRVASTDEVDDNDSTEGSLHHGWLETMFEQFMDSCVAVCQKSMSLLQSDVLVEEIFAMLNSCLLSDSGALAVRGLRRLEQFVISDLEPSTIGDDSWATVSHMLRRCLLVRGLPTSMPTREEEINDETVDSERAEFEAEVKEFLIEDSLLRDRRYVGPNAVMVIGQLLSTERFCNAMGLKWQLFLIAGLGNGVSAWDRASAVVEGLLSDDCPEYHEISLYGRKWMNRFLLKLASLPLVVKATSDDDPKTNRHAAAQKIVLDETEKLLLTFVATERRVDGGEEDTKYRAILERQGKLVAELLTGYNSMDSEHLKDMAWISPVLLGSCISSRDESLRTSVQKLVRRTSPASETPYPPPDSPKAESKKDSESAIPEKGAGSDEAIEQDVAVATEEAAVAAQVE